MNGTSSDSVTRAIEYLSAVEIAPNRYAWRTPHGWCAAPRDFFSAAEERVRPGGRIYYYVFNAHQSEVAQMPSWWTLERRAAWRIWDCNVTPAVLLDSRFASKAEAMRAVGFDPTCSLPNYGFERVSVDLATGQEVRA